jgi:hypothetical protein
VDYRGTYEIMKKELKVTEQEREDFAMLGTIK